MNFHQFAFNNVLRNRRAYFAYFLSITLSSALFFLFTMFMFHPSLHKDALTKTIQSALFVTEIVAYVFLFLFIFYSVGVFLKGRFNQFGTLFILGISRLQLNRLIFLENIIISSIASITGIAIGLVFAKFFLLITSKLLITTVFSFYIPINAIGMTFAGFVMLAVLVSIFSIFSIKEGEVLKLLKGTRMPRKEPKLSIIFLILAIAGFSWGYYTAATATMKNVAIVFLPVTFIVIIATYFFYSQVSVFAMKVMKFYKGFYCKRINMIWISDLIYRIRENAKMFFIITITSAVAFTAIGSIYAYRINSEGDTSYMTPQALYYSTNDKRPVDEKALTYIESLLKKNKINFYEASGMRKAWQDITVISQKDYNALAISFNMDEITLKTGEMYYINLKDMSEKKEYIINNKRYRVTGSSKKAMFPAFYYVDTFVIPDKEFAEIKTKQHTYYTSFYSDDWKRTYDLTMQTNKYLEKLNKGRNYRLSSKAEGFYVTRQSTGVVMFLALFIGMIFFITTGSFQYNKFYVDAIEDRKKYKSLVKLGMTNKELQRILTIEIGVLFIIPYFVAVVHSSFALKALNNSMGIPVTKSAFLVMGSFFVVQMLYFLVIRTFYLREIKNYIS